jgi:uncharacterized protein YukE
LTGAQGGDRVNAVDDRTGVSVYFRSDYFLKGRSMDLKDYDAPSVVLKNCTGETKIESFKTISDRLDKAADEIDREADKLDKAIKRVDPQTDKLQKDFLKFLEQMSRAVSIGSDAAEGMRSASYALRDLTKTYVRELKEATDTTSALQDMYSTLAKAIDKANKSNSSADKMKAEIAAKAYEKACKAAEKQLYVLAATNKSAQKSYEKSAKFSKQSYLSSAESMERVLTRNKNYLGKDESEAAKIKSEFEKAKSDLAWAKSLSK